MSTDEEMAGEVVTIFIARSGGQPVERVEEIEALKDRGLAGDRFVEGTSYWSGVDECQVTLIALEALEEIATKTEVSVMEGQHRRNIVTRGVDLLKLRGRASEWVTRFSSLIAPGPHAVTSSRSPNEA